MADVVTIAQRFRGPPQSGNGGYTCGLVARAIDSPVAEVTLKMPPPLDRELSLERGADGSVELRDGDQLVAEGRPLDSLDVEPPDPVSLEDVTSARDASPLHEHHPWPMCFVCGPDRGPGDGLRVISGRIEGSGLVGSPWETGDSLPSEGGTLAPEIVWAALDCPSGHAVMQETEEPVVAALGRLSARIDAAVRPGETYVAVGWPIERDGRKLHSGSAIFSLSGELLACARAVWIELKGEMLGAQS
jgi:hypothetical protein